MNKKPSPSAWGTMAAVGQLGLTVAIPIALGAILGSYLDGRFTTGHLFVLLGLLLGLIAGIYGAYRLFSRLL
jgi:ATP synthase protein I